MDPVEVIQADEDRFVVVVRLWGQSKPSGIQVEQRFAMLYTIRDDKVFRLTVYPDREAALEAAVATSLS
jgi:ketosteroid isomerase-like protein